MGSWSVAAIRVTDREEVLVAKTAEAGSARSSFPNTSALVSRSSRTASITNSTSGPAAHGSASGTSRATDASRSAADIRPLATARSSIDATKPNASRTASGRTSASSTV